MIIIIISIVNLIGKLTLNFLLTFGIGRTLVTDGREGPIDPHVHPPSDRVYSKCQNRVVEKILPVGQISQNRPVAAQWDIFGIWLFVQVSTLVFISKDKLRKH